MDGHCTTMTAETLKPFLTANGPMENLTASGALKATNGTSMALAVGKVNTAAAERQRVCSTNRFQIVLISLTVFLLSVLMLSVLVSVFDGGWSLCFPQSHP